MSSKGWVTRKREQFELFSRSQEQGKSQPAERKVPLPVSSSPTRDLEKKVKLSVINVEQKCIKEDVQDEEVKRVVVEQTDEKQENENFRSVAIRESTRPSGTGTRDTKKQETVNIINNNNNNNNNTNNVMINLNMKRDSSVKVRSTQEKQATKKLVYTQYREMLKRYEQSSRL